ncbi:hypothetical protein [Desulfosporosinus sp. OT]|uniref:hypothetical protein n=1 Tax=Desulfosporosinus sp. OT TaxID=913865 RepID=UPI001300BFE2|nr:hypothetical protein [Desulfosporosinus sp. OT]
MHHLGGDHLVQEKPSPVMDSVVSLVDAWLAADQHVRPKQRHICLEGRISVFPYRSDKAEMIKMAESISEK